MNNHDRINLILNDINKFGNSTFIIVTGGIGDFLSIDYFFKFSQIKNIIFVSKQSLKLKKICKLYNTDSHNNFYSLYFNFSLIGKPGFNEINEFLKYFPIFKNIHVVNKIEYFNHIRNLYLNKYHQNQNNIFSKIIKNVKLNFNIPDTFALISPYTEDNRISCILCNYIHKGIASCGLTRNFINRDYLNVIDFLKKTGITGVIISIKNINVQNIYDDVKLINLSTKLGIEDCIDLTKQCSYFFGIDNLFSVIASKILPQQNIYVKCNNCNGCNNKDIYWYPNKNINLQSFININ